MSAGKIWRRFFVGHEQWGILQFFYILKMCLLYLTIHWLCANHEIHASDLGFMMRQKWKHDVFVPIKTLHIMFLPLLIFAFVEQVVSWYGCYLSCVAEGLKFIIRPGSDHCLALYVSSWLTDFIETWLIRLYQLLVYFDADVDLGVADSLFSSVQLTLLWQLIEGLLAAWWLLKVRLATALQYVDGMATA